MRASKELRDLVEHSPNARKHQLTFLRACLVASVGAACFALAFPPFDLWPLTFVAVAPLAWVAINAVSTRGAVAAVFLTQFLMWLWLNLWMANVTLAGYPVLGLYMSIYPALFAWIVRRISRAPAMSQVPWTLTVPIVWAGMEILRGEFAFNGYPWHLLSHPLINWLTFAQSADVIGTYGLTFLAALASGAIVDVALAHRHAAPLRRVAAAAACLVAIIALNLAYGAWRISHTASLSPGPRILAIQTNLPQSNKVGWSPIEQVEDFVRFCQLTIAAHQDALARGESIDLIAWPETMLPGFGLELETLKFLADGHFDPGDSFARGIEAVRQRLNVPMLLGSPTYLGLRTENDEWVWDTQYNSAYLLQDAPLHQRYDKSVLTPFGETMPYISNWKWLERKLLALGARGMKFELSANPNIKLLELRSDQSAPNAAPQASSLTPQASYTLATPICFEDTVPALCRRMVYENGSKRADVLVNLSNDGWFADDDSIRHLHVQIARFRCIENRVPMVRVVNTGTSVSFDSAGRIVDVIGSGPYGEARQAGSLLAATTLDSRHSIFGRVGDLFGVLCLFATLAMLVGTFFRRTQTPSAAS